MGRRFGVLFVETGLQNKMLELCAEKFCISSKLEDSVVKIIDFSKSTDLPSQLGQYFLKITTGLIWMYRSYHHFENKTINNSHCIINDQILLPTNKLLYASFFFCFFFKKGTRRQRSGKGAIRKRFPLQKPRREKNQTINKVLIP